MFRDIEKCNACLPAYSIVVEHSKVDGSIWGFKHGCWRKWTKMPQTQRWPSATHLKTIRKSSSVKRHFFQMTKNYFIIHLLINSLI